MILDLKFDSLAHINTPAVSALEAANDIETFHARLALRPPKGVYAISMQQVVDRISSVARKTITLPKIDDSGKAVDDARNEYVTALDAMLDACMEHLDDLNSVIKCFFTSENDPKYKKIYDEFKKAIRPYRNHVAKMVNKIKHEQGRLRLICHESALGQIIGYFIESSDENGVIGPDPEIHILGQTAFSISRDLRFHLCGIFFVAAQLAQAVYKACGIGVNGKPQHNQRLIEMIQEIAAISPMFFPDELKKPFPAVKITSSKLHLTFGLQNLERARAPSHGKLSVSYRGDGVSRSFRIPYTLQQR